MSARLFVGGLDSAMTRDDLEREFGKYGQLKEVWMAQNPPGFAFVEFEDTSCVDDAVREMNGALVNGALLRVERARDKSKTARGANGGGIGPFRPRSRRGGAAGAAAGSYQQAGLERKMMRHAPTAAAASTPPETTPPMPTGFAVGAAPGAQGYGYDYAAMQNQYAAAPVYAPAMPAATSWESPYGATYYAAPASGYAPYYGEYYGMPANMAAAPMPVADPSVAAPLYQPPDYGQM
ncbi:hypothetical protein HPB50_022943 [Hyalomma asiaticum]|uniref:Uncharacterized protein n=1 Tax=Hyalomma asiaticum TaxID=266040 RepID=A0ACB7T2J4_HYAAI|nr:hypothetical protein HPB50_022943 [Hyalomma asiaticum]